MTDQHWWRAFAQAGRHEVREPLGPDAWPRYFAADPEVELDLGQLTLAGRRIDLLARRTERLLRTGDDEVAALDLSGPPDPRGGYDRPVRLLGAPGSVVLHTDGSAGTRLRGPLRFLQVAVGDRSWVWHFAGGRAAGERLVLEPGTVPGRAAALVTTHPAATGRSLGNPTGGAGADTRATRWEPDAAPADVLVAELLATARLESLVDYRAARVASGLSELLESAPRPDANTE